MTIKELYQQYLDKERESDTFDKRFNKYVVVLNLPPKYNTWPKEIQDKYQNDKKQVEKEVDDLEDQIFEALEGKIYKLDDENYLVPYDGFFMVFGIKHDD